MKARDHDREVRAIYARHQADLTALRTRHVREVAALQAEIQGLRTQLDVLQRAPTVNQYYIGLTADLQQVVDRYAVALDRDGATIAALYRACEAHGIDPNPYFDEDDVQARLTTPPPGGWRPASPA